MKLVQYEKISTIKGDIISVNHVKDVGIGEIAKITKKDGTIAIASVIKIEGKTVYLQVFSGGYGIYTGDSITFLGIQPTVLYGESMFGKQFNAICQVVDGGALGYDLTKEEISRATFNPKSRIVPSKMIRTDIPMIDVFNCLVESQKIPIFSYTGQKHNELLLRIAKQTDATVVVIAGMGLSSRDNILFSNFMQEISQEKKCIMYVHNAIDSSVECLLIPDLALTVAEKLALSGETVLVLLSDMTTFSNALRTVSVSMDQMPANRGFPGSLYSELASRYEKAVLLGDNGGSVTVIAVTTLPGEDITHPIPDNTGYITEGQISFIGDSIDPFTSLSRLKQLVMPHTREDHAALSSLMVQMFSDAQIALEKSNMGFELSEFDQKLLIYEKTFREKLMPWTINMKLEDALNLGWNILSSIFERDELTIREDLLDKYYRKPE